MKRLFLFLTFIILFTCSKDDNESNTNTIENNNIVYTGPSDPLLISTTLPTNETIEVYGVRDLNGLPVSINHIILRNEINEETIYRLDETGRLDYLKAYDGTVSKFEWQDNQIELTVIGASKESFFKTTVYLNDILNRMTYSNVSSREKNLTSTKSNMNRNENNNIQVNVFRCGTLAEYEGTVNIQLDNSSIPGENGLPFQMSTSYLSRTGVGTYTGGIKSPNGEPLGPNQLCQVLEPLLENLCDIYSPSGTVIDTTLLGEAICLQIGGALSLIGTPLVGISATALCTAVNTFFSFACTFTGFCSSADFKNLSLNRQEYPIRAVLEGPDGSIEGPWIDIDFRDPLPTLEINLGDNFTHLTEISAPLLDCESNWEAYVDDINLGPISSEFPIFTTIPIGEHTVYLKNGVQFTENWNDPISFPCEGSGENNFSFDVECEDQVNFIEFANTGQILQFDIFNIDSNIFSIPSCGGFEFEHIFNPSATGTADYLFLLITDSNEILEDGTYTIGGSSCFTGIEFTHPDINSSSFDNDNNVIDGTIIVSENGTKFQFQGTVIKEDGNLNLGQANGVFVTD